MKFTDFLYGYTLTTYWNILNMPAGVVPHGFVNFDETNYQEDEGIKDFFTS